VTQKQQPAVPASESGRHAGRRSSLHLLTCGRLVSATESGTVGPSRSNFHPPALTTKLGAKTDCIHLPPF
jgi:hypothetical protein